jgi:hypothetical protein
MISLVGLLVFGAIDLQTALSPEFTDQELTIGDPVELVATLRYDRSTEVSPPIADSLGSFAVLGTDSEMTEEDGYVVHQYRIKLAPFNTGTVTLPQFMFLVKEGETIDTVSTRPFQLEIASTLPEAMSDINQLKGPVEYPNRLPFIVAGIVAASGIAVWFLWQLLKKVRRMRELVESLPPPWIEALIALENIPAREWIDRGLIKKYYYSLSDILKRYLERRFEFNALEQTTTEIVDHLKKKNVGLRDEFTRFFTDTDLVKYTKFRPDLDDQQAAIERAKDLVNKSRPSAIEVVR